MSRIQVTLNLRRTLQDWTGFRSKPMDHSQTERRLPDWPERPKLSSRLSSGLRVVALLSGEQLSETGAHFSLLSEKSTFLTSFVHTFLLVPPSAIADSHYYHCCYWPLPLLLLPMLHCPQLSSYCFLLRSNNLSFVDTLEWRSLMTMLLLWVWYTIAIYCYCSSSTTALLLQ